VAQLACASMVANSRAARTTASFMGPSQSRKFLDELPRTNFRIRNLFG
jgi:hypothetical protein